MMRFSANRRIDLKGAKEDIKEAGKATGGRQEDEKAVKTTTKKAVNKTAEKTEEAQGPPQDDESVASLLGQPDKSPTRSYEGVRQIILGSAMVKGRACKECKLARGRSVGDSQQQGVRAGMPAFRVPA